MGLASQLVTWRFNNIMRGFYLKINKKNDIEYKIWPPTISIEVRPQFDIIGQRIKKEINPGIIFSIRECIADVRSAIPYFQSPPGEVICQGRGRNDPPSQLDKQLGLKPTSLFNPGHIRTIVIPPGCPPAMSVNGNSFGSIFFFFSNSSYETCVFPILFH